jgi:hypothetical protein
MRRKHRIHSPIHSKKKNIVNNEAVAMETREHPGPPIGRGTGRKPAPGSWSRGRGYDGPSMRRRTQARTAGSGAVRLRFGGQGSDMHHSTCRAKRMISGSIMMRIRGPASAQPSCTELLKRACVDSSSAQSTANRNVPCGLSVRSWRCSRCRLARHGPPANTGTAAGCFASPARTYKKENKTVNEKFRTKVLSSH